MPINQELDTFLDSLPSPSTRSAYAAGLKAVLADFPAQHPKGLFSREQAQTVYAKLSNSDRSSASKNQSLAACRAWGRFLCKSGVIQSNGFAALPYFKSRSGISESPRGLSMDELRRLAACLDKLEGRTAARDVLMCKLIYSSGLKVSDVTGLRVRDLNFRDGSVQLSRRSVAIYPDLIAQLKNYLDTDRPELLGNTESDALFPSTSGSRLSRTTVFRIIQKAGKACDLDISPSTLRNTFAQIAFAQGIDLSVLSRALGHKHLQNTSRVAGASPLDAARAHLLCHPRNSD